MTEATSHIKPDHPHLHQLLGQAEEISREVEQLRTRLTTAQLVWKPGPEVWNVLECIDHLTKTGEVYYGRMQEALEQADRADPAQPYAPTRFGKFFIRMVSPSSKRKLKTFRVFKPTPALEDATALDRFLEQQKTLTEMIGAAAGVNVNTGRFSSPASRLVRFSIGEALTMIVTHQQRHVLQAKNLIQRPDFPDRQGV